MVAELAALRDRFSEIVPVGTVPEGAAFHALTTDGTPVELIILAPQLIARVRHRDHFAAALARASRIKNEGMLTLVDSGHAQSTFYCAYARGETVEPSPGALSSTDVASIGVGLGRALHALHRDGHVHGAIATRRIRLTAHGAPRLASFGLLPALIEGGADVRDVSTELCEAPYVSPEQQAGELPSPGGDIYALGASLYELLTGKAPFGGRTTSFVMATVLPEEPTSAGRDTTRADRVITALLRAIEQDPSDRWPSAAAFADALERAESGSSDDASSAGQPASGLSRLRSAFSAIFPAAWFRPDGRGSNPEESPGSKGRTAR